LKSATYSPAQATVTNPANMYSATSQRDRDLANDETSDAVRIILVHKRRENAVLLVCITALVAILAKRVYGTTTQWPRQIA